LNLVPSGAYPSVIAWGDNQFGATSLPANLSNVDEIAAGYSSSLARRADGTVTAWGNPATSTNVPSGLTNIVQIAAGDYHDLALRQDGTVVSWGSQTNVPQGLAGVATIAGGGCASMALTRDGTVTVWGNCSNGESNVPAGLSDVIGIAAGYAHFLALKRNGTVVAWGEAGPYSHYGQTNVPPMLSTATSVGSRLDYGFASKSDGTIALWGYHPSIPNLIQAPLPCGLRALSAGNNALLGLRSDGTLVTWATSALPTNVWSVSQIAAGAAHFLALGWTPFGPQITAFPNNQTVVAGSKLTLSALVAGTQPFSYQWQKDGVGLRRGTNATLEISSIADFQAGNYTLVVSNALGAVTGATAQVTVLYPIQIGGNAGGFVSKSPDSTGYAYGQTVGLTAAPAPGWQFLQWLGDVTGTNASNSIVMTQPRCAQAMFGTTLNTSVSGSGAVLVHPIGGIFPYGTEARLTAVPQEGNYFAGWSGAASGSKNPLRFLVTNANPMVSCLFSPLSSGQFALTIIGNGDGQVIQSPDANRYNSNDTVTLTAWPGQNQDFWSWSGDEAGTESNLAVIMNQSKIVTANFTKRPRLSVGPCLGGWNENGFQFTLAGELSGSFKIQSSLDASQWTDLATITNWFGTSQFMDLRDTNRFYRLFRAVLVQ